MAESYQSIRHLLMLINKTVQTLERILVASDWFMFGLCLDVFEVHLCLSIEFCIA
jgi:hypothetical protein